MSGHVHVGIYTDTTFADLCLPATLRIGELLPHIHATLTTTNSTDDGGGGGGAAGGPGSAADSTPDGPETVAGWGLARVGQPVFSNDATLAVLGVADGDLLAFVRPDAPTPPAPVIEDLADATATYATHTPFGHHLRGIAAGYATITAVVVWCVLAGYSWYAGHRLIAAGVYAILTTCVAVTVIIAASRRGGGGGGAGAGVADRAGLLAPALAALTAAALCPPAVLTPARIALAAAAAGFASVFVLKTTGRWVALHTGVAASTATTTALCVAAALWHPNVRVWGCVVMTVALLLSRNAATMAAWLAGYPLADVPAPGEKTPTPLDPDTLAALSAKTVTAAAHHSGLTASVALTTAIGAMLVCWPAPPPPLAAYWLAAAAVTVTAMRARILDSATCVLWLLATPAIALTLLAGLDTATGHQLAGLIAAALLGGYALTLVVAAMLPAVDQHSIPVRNNVQRAETLLVVTIFPAMVWLSGLFDAIRNLNLIGHR